MAQHHALVADGFVALRREQHVACCNVCCCLLRPACSVLVDSLIAVGWQLLSV